MLKRRETNIITHLIENLAYFIIANIPKIRNPRSLTLLKATFPILIFLFAFSIIGSNTTLLATTEAYIDNVYMLTTRENQNLPQGVTEYGYNNIYRFDNIEQLYSSCPTEVVIFVHGWLASKDMAKEQLDRVKLSLEHENNKYTDISLIGFSWPSDTNPSPTGWGDAKLIAKDNGPKLADFIFDYMRYCKEEYNKHTDIRLLGHSLGARVILSALQDLYDESRGRIIRSVHLMGAAVDDREVSVNHIDPFYFLDAVLDYWKLTSLQPFFGGSCTIDSTGVKFAYGEAIYYTVTKFYNLVNIQDNALEDLYPCNEGGNTALGVQMYPPATPDKYIPKDVKHQIKYIQDADVDGQCDQPWRGRCTITGVGDNHMGYMGFRDPANNSLLLDDGAIDEVVNHWRSN